MRRLILTRHAKSAWDDPRLSDFDRPLNDRGLRSANALGQWLLRGEHIPDEVFVSGARRTVETWGGISNAFENPPEMQERPTLYEASSDAILNVLRQADGETVMLIAHNPGIGDFASRVLVEYPTHPRYRDYPTGATAILEFDIDDWAKAAWTSAKLIDFIIPRELIPDQ